MVARLLPSLEIIHPENGNEMKNPSGRASSIIPSSVTWMLRAACTVGIRDAQAEKHRPCMKKNALTLHRFNRRPFSAVAKSEFSVERVIRAIYLQYYALIYVIMQHLVVIFAI